VQIIATPIPTATAVTLGDDAAGAYIIDPPPIPVEKRQIQIEQLVLEPRASPMGSATPKPASPGRSPASTRTNPRPTPLCGATRPPCP